MMERRTLLKYMSALPIVAVLPKWISPQKLGSYKGYKGYKGYEVIGSYEELSDYIYDVTPYRA